MSEPIKAWAVFAKDGQISSLSIDDKADVEAIITFLENDDNDFIQEWERDWVPLGYTCEPVTITRGHNE